MIKNIFAGIRKFLIMRIININRLPEQMFEMVIRKPCKSNFLMENVVRTFTCECELPLHCPTITCSSL